MFGGRFAGAIATSASLSLELDNALMCYDTMILVFLMYTSKQSLSQRRRSLIYQPFMPASASSTQAFTPIEWHKMSFNSSCDMFGVVDVTTDLKY